MKFAYYIPRLAYNEATDEKLVAIGLGDRFRDCFGRMSHAHITRSQIHSNGPDGSSGAWVYPTGDPPVLWKPGLWESQLSDNGEFHLCWQKGATTDPELLKRRKIVTGENLELLDGKVWHCPTIRRLMGVANVPCAYERRSGEVTREVVPAYRGIWNASGEWIRDYLTAGVGIDEPALFEIAATCIGLNYRVGDEELRLLSLFDYESMKRVLHVAIDFDAVREFLVAQDAEEESQKKSVPESGQEGDTNMQHGDAA